MPCSILLAGAGCSMPCHATCHNTLHAGLIPAGVSKLKSSCTAKLAASGMDRLTVTWAHWLSQELLGEEGGGGWPRCMQVHAGLGYLAGCDTVT